MGDEEADSPSTPLLSAVGGVRTAVAHLRAQLGGDVVWQSTDREVLAAVGDLAGVRAALDETHLRLVREVDTRGVAEASPVATTPEGFLRTACLVTALQARQDVAAARATAPGAPLHPFGVLLARGEVSRRHVDSAVRCLDRIPTAVLERPGFADEAVSYLLLATEGGTAVDVDVAAKHLLASLVPDREDRLDERSFERRFLDLATDATGMTVGRFQLDPVAGAALRAALHRWSAPEAAGQAAAGQADLGQADLGMLRGDRADGWGADCADPGQPDRRQPRQRRAEAFGHLVQVALGVEAPHRGERPRVVLSLTLDQLEQLEQTRRTARSGEGSGYVGLPEVEGGGPIPTSAARTLACDAVLQRVVLSPAEAPLELSRTVRLASVTQRRALAVRDGGCVVPGCTAPPQACDAHHVTHWADGGPTDSRNLCLLCPAHHTAVHAGTWAVAIDREGQVMVTPPPWVDRLRRPRPAWNQRARRAA